MTAGSYCTHCGAKIEPTSKFCPSCGRAISLAEAQETTTTAAVTPGKGLKNAGKIIVAIGLVFMILMLIGGGGGTAVLFNFFVIILPGLIIYGAGNRKYKK